MKTFADFVLAADTAHRPVYERCVWWVHTLASPSGAGWIEPIRWTDNPTPWSMVLNQTAALFDARARYQFRAGDFELERVCYPPGATPDQAQTAIIDAWHTPCIDPFFATLLTHADMICPPGIV